MDETVCESLPRPSAVHARAEVIDNRCLAKNTFSMRLRCPDLARVILPGQFFMVRLPGTSDPLLGRPFALFDTVLNEHGEPVGVEFGYVVVGKVTGLLAEMGAGQAVDVWGPLGNGFPPPPSAGRLLMVAGGIGQTPFLAVSQEATGRRRYGSPARVVTPMSTTPVLCYGARSAEYLAGVSEFENAGIEVRISTDDGSAGHHGLVTELLSNALDESTSATTVYCCGPEPMMAAVSKIAVDRNVPCLASLETPMACGFGACFSCVVPVRDDAGWDYRRVCLEGPVFPADRLHWGDPREVIS